MLYIILIIYGLGSGDPEVTRGLDGRVFHTKEHCETVLHHNIGSTELMDEEELESAAWKYSRYWSAAWCQAIDADSLDHDHAHQGMHTRHGLDANGGRGHVHGRWYAVPPVHDHDDDRVFHQHPHAPGHHQHGHPEQRMGPRGTALPHHEHD